MVVLERPRGALSTNGDRSCGPPSERLLSCLQNASRQTSCVTELTGILGVCLASSRLASPRRSCVSWRRYDVWRDGPTSDCRRRARSYNTASLPSWWESRRLAARLSHAFHRRRFWLWPCQPHIAQQARCVTRRWWEIHGPAAAREPARSAAYFGRKC